VLATACDVAEEVYLKYIVARLATYLQIPGYGDMLVAINGWDPDTLQRFRTDQAVTSVGGLIDSVATTRQLAAIDRLIPEAWRPAAVGNAAGRVSMSSTKSSTGHLLGAAGAVEAIFSILAMRDGVAPPTINLDNPSVETPIDLVPHQARKREISVALSNSFGFGGTNASLVFRRVAD